MWTQVQINGLDVFTQYPSLSAGPDVLTGGLDATQVRTRNAHHEAGHAVIGMAEGPAGVPRGPWCRLGGNPSPPGRARTSIRERLGRPVLGGTPSPATPFLNDVVAGVGDQAKLRSVDAAQPVLFIYGTGRPQQVPDGWDHVELATVYARVDDLVERYWPYIAAVAGPSARARPGGCRGSGGSSSREPSGPTAGQSRAVRCLRSRRPRSRPP